MVITRPIMSKYEHTLAGKHTRTHYQHQHGLQFICLSVVMTVAFLPLLQFSSHDVTRWCVSARKLQVERSLSPQSGLNLRLCDLECCKHILSEPVLFIYVTGGSTHVLPLYRTFIILSCSGYVSASHSVFSVSCWPDVFQILDGWIGG